MRLLRGWAIALLLTCTAVDARPLSPDLSLVGSYGAAEGDAMVFERGGGLFLARKGHAAEALKPLGSGRYRAGSAVAAVTAKGLTIEGRTLARRDFGAETEAAIWAAVRRDGAALRQAALAATPPAEPPARRSSDLVSLDGLGGRFPSQLSGGEQQRVAVARAIVKCPDVLLCDEPTGALDYETGKVVLAAILRVNEQLGTTTVVITHNASIAGLADRVLKLGGGRIIGEERNAHRLSRSKCGHEGP